MDPNADPAALRARQEEVQAASGPGAAPAATDNLAFINQFAVDDTDSILTSDVGGQIEDQASLKAGERGPTLLEDFILRQKITHFDHERVSSFGTSLLVRTLGTNRYRSPSAPCMLVARAPMVLLYRMPTGAI